MMYFIDVKIILSWTFTGMLREYGQIATHSAMHIDGLLPAYEDRNLT
jgi:hypothetical protein